MRTQVRAALVVSAVALLAVGSALRAAPPEVTVISVPDMECKGCAKKIVTRLSAAPGVARVEPDVESRSVRVTPKGQATLSPRALWEAVEKAGKQPDWLQGPSGTFKAKPQS